MRQKNDIGDCGDRQRRQGTLNESMAVESMNCVRAAGTAGVPLPESQLTPCPDLTAANVMPARC